MAATCVVVPIGPGCVDLDGATTGDSNPVIITIKAGGVGVDLSSSNIAAQARKKKTDPDPAVMEAGITAIDLVHGKFALTWDVPRTIFNGSDKWTGVWDIQIDDRTPFGGKFIAKYDVTRPP